MSAAISWMQIPKKINRFNVFNVPPPLLPFKDAPWLDCLDACSRKYRDQLLQMVDIFLSSYKIACSVSRVFQKFTWSFIWISDILSRAMFALKHSKELQNADIFEEDFRFFYANFSFLETIFYFLEANFLFFFFENDFWIFVAVTKFCILRQWRNFVFSE